MQGKLPSRCKYYTSSTRLNLGWGQISVDIRKCFAPVDIGAARPRRVFHFWVLRSKNSFGTLLPQWLPHVFPSPILKPASIRYRLRFYHLVLVYPVTYNLFSGTSIYFQLFVRQDIVEIGNTYDSSLPFNILDYLPLYFQACKLSSPIKSGVEVLPTAFGILVFALIAGISIVKTGAYRPQLWLSCCFLMLSAGLMSTVGADTSTSNSIGFQVLMSVGHGILQGSPTFPILAPIDASLSANALAFFMFIRFFSQVSILFNHPWL